MNICFFTPHGGASGKEPTSLCRRHKRLRFSPWVWKILWSRMWQPTTVSPPGFLCRRHKRLRFNPWVWKILWSRTWQPTAVSLPRFLCRRHERVRFNPWVWKILWSRTRQPTVASLPGESSGQRSPVGHSPRCHTVSGRTEWLRTPHLKP